ncbi:penicillin-binding protein [Actinomadura sp. HBU206391]|uniref:penicillin-binding protein n=1 Tax=Actinomadura sp. HBU206391 TaxID=2731692 RepID=UPI0016509984|nr:transglycosylase domain-containing protein [Actinomadura sp. HBU206391]MBC6456335.1 transglycosylase domain-containing protein [Actinomadura sp. HBU206391]
MRVADEGTENIVVKLFRLIGAAVVAGVLVALIALPVVGSTGVSARNASDSFQNMPSDLKTTPPPEKTVLYDTSGKPIATFFDKYRESVRLEQVNPIMKKAIVAIEDSRFYEHGALDPKGAIRALATNVEAGETAQGGSTLTQQYVKNLLVENAKTDEEYRAVTAPTAGRKLRELRYAIDIEHKMSKDQILEGYLNIAYFGGGAYGVQAAAKRYFSKPASKLNLEQAALLAGITKNPSAFDPTRNPKDARNRRDTVINRMAELKIVTRAEADAAAKKPIKLNETKPEGGCETGTAPFFCEYVRHEMVDILAKGKKDDKSIENAKRQLQRGGFTIRTTLDPQAQKAAQNGILSRVGVKNDRSAAQTMVEPGTGKIRAMAVNRKFGTKRKKGETVLNLAADVAHGGGYGYTAGSTFKIFTLAAALDKGIPIRTSINSPQTITISGFKGCKGEGFEPWRVSNAGDSEAGNFNLRNGTWHSVNTFYAELEKRVGLCESVKMAERFGLRQVTGKPLKQIPSQVLGANEVDVTSLAAAYAGFAARGKYCPPVAITEVTDPDGRALKLPKTQCKQAVDEDVADQVNDILRGVLTKGTAAGIGNVGRPAAGKTGTCEEFTCALFAGYTPDLASAVWYGDADYPWKNRVYGIYGATIPGPIWAQSMREALKGKPVRSFSEPSNRFGDVEEISVPDVQGMSVRIARSTLEGAGFDVSVSTRPVRSNEARGTVARTSPAGGTQLEEGSNVTIFVSDGTGNRQDLGNGNGNSGRNGNGNGFEWPFGD